MADQLVKRIRIDAGASCTNGVSLPTLLITLGRCTLLQRALCKLGR